ncbi:IS1182 family transposase [Porticoccus sp. W117]|uniref:IS1182 family transposase n=1 Tax=Porticoccus sp. W117 TaxID=3054777 RepID=UPI002599A6BE|nr:IS1182 family transposase [Porticoccus sp. W117]MDM3872686.1 IS1182 family transposase [Porticoccus sp. W117]
MRHIQGESRTQTSLLPASVEDYVGQEHPVRVIEAFVATLDIQQLGFTKAIPKITGRKPYDPADLLKLYLYGYQNRITSSRKLERECHRNLEVMWLLRRLVPDFKTIADFRRDNGSAIHQAGRDFVQFCRLIGAVSGDLVAIDGSKFQAAASKDQAFTRDQLRKEQDRVSRRISRYMEELDRADAQEDEAEAEGIPAYDPKAIEEALEQLRKRSKRLDQASEVMAQEDKRQHCLTEPDARLMRSGRGGVILGYNLQSAVDVESGVIVHHALTTEAADNRQLLPMATAAQGLLERKELQVVADAGYSNGEQLAKCDDKGIAAVVPANRAVNNQGDGQFYPKSVFQYDAEADQFICPAGKNLPYKTRNTKCKKHLYSRDGCSQCPLQSKCTQVDRRWVSRHFHEDAFERAENRLAAQPDLMTVRMAAVERPFAILKRHMGLKRMQCRGLHSAKSEISLGVLSYNLARMTNRYGVNALLRELK